MLNQLKHAALAALLLCSVIPAAHADTAQAAVPFTAATPASFRLSEADKQLYKKAFAAIARNQFKEAETLANGTSDKTLATVVRWHTLRYAPGNRFAEYADFLTANPGFPHADILRQRAEKSLSASDSIQKVQQWFASTAPSTTEGKLTFLDLTQFSGNAEQATTIVRDIWSNNDLTASQESLFLRTYGQHLRQEDHLARMNRLLWIQDYSALDRMQQFLPAEYRALSRARRGFQVGAPDVVKRLEAVPASLQQDAGLLFDRSKWLRRRGDNTSARTLLKQVSGNQPFADKWWVERDYQIREAIEEKKYEEAYALASRHEQSEGEFYSEAEFLAGWTAVRMLNKPDNALPHFQAFYDKAQTPVSKAKAAWWLAYTLERQGDKVKAPQYLAEASKHPVTFYGQMAAQKLAVMPALPETVWPNQTEFATFHSNPVVIAVLQLAAIDQQQRTAPFLLALSEQSQSPGTLSLVTNLAKSVGRPDMSVRIAKLAKAKGIVLAGAEFPLITIPGTVKEPETALIHAIIRQESEFAYWVSSPVGARGLMQLMPATARMEAQAAGLPYVAAKLTTDTGYNMRLGSQHLARNIERFEGSYPMAVAAYNAGGGNVQRWLDRYGDPRQNTISYVDWMEMIPFRETRNYVQRVLEGLEVYRLRLAQQQVNPGQVQKYAWCTLSCTLVPGVRQRNYMLAASR